MKRDLVYQFQDPSKNLLVSYYYCIFTCCMLCLLIFYCLVLHDILFSKDILAIHFGRIISGVVCSLLHYLRKRFHSY